MTVYPIRALAFISALAAAAGTSYAQNFSDPPPPIVAAPAGLNYSSGPQYPTPVGYGDPVAVGEMLYASGGDVLVTDLGPTGAEYSEDLFVYTPATGYGLFMNNHATANGTTFDLGSFAAGTEIEFGIYVEGYGYTWYDGPGSRNSDGDVHAYMVNDYEGLANTTYVGFEDEPGSFADFNYADEIYAFTGVTAALTAPAPVPDAASTMALLGTGLSALLAARRRFRR
jgi:hypothetical protein